MANMIVHPGTGFVEFFRTKDEEDLANYKDQVDDLKKELEELKKLIKSGDDNASEN